MRSRRTVFLNVVCLIAAACSNDSEKLTKEIQDAGSWIASARMVSSSYADGAVTKRYARDALESFNHQLESIAKRVQSIPDGRAGQAAAGLQRAHETISQIDTAINQGDGLSLAQLDVRLADQQRALGLLVNSPNTNSP